MYKSVYDLSRDQFDELKSAYFWSDDTPEENRITASGTPALFPGDIPDHVVADFYNDVLFVDDDFSSAPGIPWTDSNLGFYEISSTDGKTYTRQWLTGAEARKHENAGYIVRRSD
jgi:hypothetical protein